jgi:hypothetical protein
MSFANLNRRVDQLATALPNPCPDCREAPAFVILLGEDASDPPAECATCGRTLPDPLVIRFVAREDGPQ